jgi:glycosyltransferase involved in cell wall biosynthesis
MTQYPLVSILLNNYNYAKYLDEAITSALEQKYEAFEVLVVDDGSTDNSRDIIRSYGSRLRMIAKDNGGQASAFNAGFAASSGDIVCLLDADDAFLPHKLSRVVQRFIDYPEIGWCFDTPKWFGTDGKERIRNPAVCDFGRLDARDMIAAGKGPYLATATSGMSFRRTTLQQILPMPETVRAGRGITNDNYIKYGALAIAVGWIEPETVSLQRIHGDNAYTNRTNGKRRLVGQTEVLTGICMYEKFPALHHLTMKMVNNGLVKLLTTGGIDPDLRAAFYPYLCSVGITRLTGALVRSTCDRAVRKLRREVRRMGDESIG